MDRRVARTLEYCEYDQIFRVSVEHSGQLLPVMDRRESEDEADNACVTLTRGVTIDPREPLGPQIEHVKKVQEALDRRFRAMGEWLYHLNQGYQMRK